jgi:hypothetical protein
LPDAQLNADADVIADRDSADARGRKSAPTSISTPNPTAAGPLPSDATPTVEPDHE